MARKLLVLGGTRFVGRHIVERAIAVGFDVTVFARGRTDTSWLAGARLVVGDRRSDLDRVSRSKWDTIVDTSGYDAATVRASVDALRQPEAHYVFISSLSVYRDHSKLGIVEGDPTIESAAGRGRGQQSSYALGKASAERTIIEGWDDRYTIIRAGLLIGPHDTHQRFSYWPTRLAAGGPILAPSPPEIPLQLIDARDHANFVVQACQREILGVYNATSAPNAISFRSMLEACSSSSSAPDIRWVDQQNLAVHLIPDRELPLWYGPSPSLAGTMLMETQRAKDAGLVCRPLAETAQDAINWANSVGESRSPDWLTTEKEQKLISWYE